MEFRSDNRFYITQQHEDQFTNRTSTFLLPSSSSSSPTAAPFSWHNPDNSQLEKEHMFDKVVTPSDVGKLNRLVIPKQHAEKYFPLNSAANEKGLLLCFEDRTGKSWRFRYSYWNSSQSYVMTKGWSRFVKEKRLDAGDTVSFGRGVGDAAARERLFIDWRRRPELIHHQPPAGFGMPPNNLTPFSRSIIGSWNGGFANGRLFGPPAIPCNYPNNYLFNASNLGSSSSSAQQQQLVYFTTPMTTRAAALQEHRGSGGLSMVLDSVPVVQNQVAAKRVRLFGVNLDCSESEEMGRDLQLQPAMSKTTLQLMEPMSFGAETPAASSSPSMIKGRNLSFDLEL